MRYFLVLCFMLAIVDAHACYDSAYNFYSSEMTERRHDNIYVYPQPKKLSAGEQTEIYGTVFQYDQDVLIFEGSSEFMSGFGVEAIVIDGANCSVIEMVQVYAE